MKRIKIIADFIIPWRSQSKVMFRRTETDWNKRQNEFVVWQKLDIVEWDDYLSELEVKELEEMYQQYKREKKLKRILK
jgi:hypothetical protein